MLKLDGEQKDLFSTGRHSEPLVCAFQDDKFALSRDDQTILVDVDGNPSTKYTLAWSESPLAMGKFLTIQHNNVAANATVTCW